MFKIPQATFDFWKRVDLMPATDAQIAEIAAVAPGPLPEDYVAFLRSYGFARWMLTVPDRFHYTRHGAGQDVTKVGSIAHLETPESIGRAMKHAWTDDPALGLPCWPKGVMPIAGNAGPGQILMQFDTAPGAIMYWEPADDAWGTGDNTQLCTVAANFTDFINGLLTRAQA